MWLSPEDVAIRYDVPLQTVYAWRQKSYGPTPVKIGRHLRYHSDDVAAFEARLRGESSASS